MNIHPNPNDETTICTTYTKKYKEKAKVNQIHLNAAICVPDRFFIDYEIQSWKNRDERMACSRMMERLSKVYSKKDLLITCDRGAESYYLMMLADSLGLKYCMGMKDVDSKVGIASRYANLKGSDGCIDADIDKKYTYCYFVMSRLNEHSDCVYCHSNHYNPFIPPTPNKAKGGDKTDGNSKFTYYQFSYRLMCFPIGEIILSMIFHSICTMALLLLSEVVQRQSENRVLAYGINYSDLASALRLFISGRDPTITIRKIVRKLLITLQPIRAS